jgi:hypothetical protein
VEEPDEVAAVDVDDPPPPPQPASARPRKAARRTPLEGTDRRIEPPLESVHDDAAEFSLPFGRSQW